MKKSRTTFVAILVAISVAGIGALAGTFVHIDLTAWLIAAALVLISVKAILQFVEEGQMDKNFSSIIDAVSILLVGGVVGTLAIIPWWIFAAAVGVSLVMLTVFIFGFTGHNN